MTEPLALPAPMSAARVFELLDISKEECAEIIQAASKVNRFGKDSINPYAPGDGTCRERLEDEFGDLLCLMNLLVKGGFLNQERIFNRAHAKKPKLLATLTSEP